MGHSGNKRRHHTQSDGRGQNRFGVADALHSAKRPRLSEDDLGATSTSHSESHASAHSTTDNNGWQTVTSKSARRRSNKQKAHREQDDNYPKLSFYDKVTQPVRIDQLRDLALYALTDTLGPTWVAVKNKHEIKKVVVTMLPGFDDHMLQRARELVKATRTTNRNQATRNLDQEPLEADSSNHSAQESNSKKDAASDRVKDGADFGHDLDWLLYDTVPVKAPGDSKYCKVHSPLQAMLMTPLTDSSDKSSSGNNADRSFKPVQTAVSYFVHTADELREAEYPIHPACFTSDRDAALESTRREGSGQSVSAGWVDTKVENSTPIVPSPSHGQVLDSLSQDMAVYAIDCEMVLTSDEKSSLARVSVVAWPDGRVVLDKYVKPDLPITNYFTQFSGITPQILENVTTKLAQVQEELLSLFDQSTVLLGHSLESDLNALKLTHPFIIDTSIVFPHPRGLPLRSSLKFLANKYLKREIQTGGANGHDSVEDARAVLDLIKLKCERGPRFGTTEAMGEPIFKRLGRAVGRDKLPRTTAIVEYGSSPERGLGKDATYAIGCQNDDQIVAGMIRAVRGDEDGREIPSGGVNFVWGRFRALEFARGWTTNVNVIAAQSVPLPETEAVRAVESQHPDASDSAKAEIDARKNTDDGSAPSKPEEPDLDSILSQTLSHLAEIHRSLPPTTLLIVYSGTSDVRPVLEYQAMQSQYRKEFKTKKWDELTVRWTDVEEQALKRAAEAARRGWGYVGIV